MSKSKSAQIQDIVHFLLFIPMYITLFCCIILLTYNCLYLFFYNLHNKKPYHPKVIRLFIICSYYVKGIYFLGCALSYTSRK